MNQTKMPALFIGHGSPMNAIDKNNFTKALAKMGSSLPKPKAILMISAHWMTKGTSVTRMKNPKTIHDFYGFPEELFKIQYAAPGSPELAQAVIDHVSAPVIQADDSTWGLDHGAWSVLMHMYPQADIPVVQLSLDMSQDPEFHFKLGEKLNFLRHQGVLIMGSGNIVHNLRKIKWEPHSEPYSWAIEFDGWVREQIRNRNYKALLEEVRSTEAGMQSVPTFEHYYPMLYILGASTHDDQIYFDYEEIQNGAISMTSVRFE